MGVGAAVSLACGHGFVDPGSGVSPALDDFLKVKRDRFSCADLPATFPPRPPDMTQGLYRYLMMTTALVWRISGISCRTDTPVRCVVRADARSGVRIVPPAGGRIMAVAATLAVMVSAIHLQSLPYLRDYAKAPFILALILVMG